MAMCLTQCIVYGTGLWEMAQIEPELEKITAAVVYGAASIATQPRLNRIPSVQHLAGKAGVPLLRTETLMQYEYSLTRNDAFALPFSPDFDYAVEGITHSRNLTFLKKHMNGPHFDLEAIWDEHTYFEFDNRSVEHTMNTMVQEPYVNHIPTVSATPSLSSLAEVPVSLSPVIECIIPVNRGDWPRASD